MIIFLKYGEMPMSQQESLAPLPPQCPQSDDPAAWEVYSDQWLAYAKYYKDRAQDIKGIDVWRDYFINWRNHWQRCDQFWRTEPEIDRQRKEKLAHCLAIRPSIERGIYPFKGIKLTRADIEWLLATHENGQGPVNWSNLNQREREGLDLRGADLRDAELSHLPLARLRGGLDWVEWHSALPLQRTMAAIQMEGAILNDASLEGTILMNAQLERANFSRVQMEEANLAYAQLKESVLYKAQMEKAGLVEAGLKGANLSGAQMQGAILMNAQLERANLSRVQMEEANLTHAQLKEAVLSGARMKAANFLEAQLEGANLSYAQMEKVNLSGAQMERANLSKAHLEEANLSEAQLEGAKLAGVVLSDGKERIGPQLADVQWGNTNLSVVKWSQVEMLGDEHLARQENEKKSDVEGKDRDWQLQEYYERAVRANRQLAVALQVQGLNEDAARFAYRAQKLQRVVFRLQGRLGKYFFYALLDSLAGYGYKPGFTVLWYLGTLSVFTLLYLLFGQVNILEAFILSLTSFHGRGFFPGSNITPCNPILIGMLAAFEAVIGLFIEISFIATFTQRFLGK
jgi:uncharacterized protein YjbI with pentapeptide repeats